jgi:hypothetical protein
MSRYFKIIFSFITILLLLTIFKTDIPALKKPLPRLENKYTLRTPLYSNERYQLYQAGNRLILINKGTAFSIQAPEENLKFSHDIKHKGTGIAPLIDRTISLGAVLDGKNDSYIFQLEPEFVLLEKYPHVDNDDHYILIKKNSNRLYYYQKGELAKNYSVSTGKETWYTPEGSFRIINKIPYPNGKSFDVPMGSRWMGLAVPCSFDKRGNKIDGGPDGRSPTGQKYGIHGTDDESTIGSHASGGCIRMYNKSIVELYEMVPIETKVKILP